nr:phage tail tape measure protein [Clostridium novyi]
MARGGNTVVARVGLDDKGFQEGVTKIQRSLKVVKSEFAAASSKLKDFSKSTEGLKLKSDSLNKQMELQKQKVAALTKSYQESVEKKGADAKATENLKVRLNYATAEMNKLQRELNETNERIRVQESRWTKLGNKLNEDGSKMQTVGKKMQDVGKSLSTKVTAPIVGVGTAAAKMSIDFQDSLAKVSTIVDTTQLSIENVKKGVLNLSNETGEGVNDLNEALYQSISARVESGKSVEFLGSAVKLAKGGFTETSSSVDLLTTILNGYKLKAEETANVSDIIINTQNLCKTSVNELSSSMGKVVPIASAANVNLKQLSSAYVLLTKKGIATAEAGTYIRSMLSELSKTGSTADKTLRQISRKSFAQLMASGKSVSDVLNMLNEHANKNNLTLKDMFGSFEAGTASMILGGAGGQDFNKVLDTMSNVAGATDTAFNKVNETTGARLKIF